MTLYKNINGDRVEMSEQEEADVEEYRKPQNQTEMDAEQEIQVQQNTENILQNDKKFRVMAQLIFDTLKAGKTGDYSQLAGVKEETTFRDHVVARFRALN